MINDSFQVILAIVMVFVINEGVTNKFELILSIEYPSASVVKIVNESVEVSKGALIHPIFRTLEVVNTAIKVLN